MREISSIFFEEDFITWTDLLINDQTIEIKKAVNDSLPLPINHQTINKSASAKQIANHLSELVEKFNLTTQNLRVSIPPRFSLIKKILFDQNLPQEKETEVIHLEFEKTLGEPEDQYEIFIPEYRREKNGCNIVMGVAIRRSVLAFFEEIFDTARFASEIISPSCFNLEEFFRSSYTEIEGQNLLLGWQNKGFDVLTLDKEGFIDYFFKPYHPALESIGQLDESGIFKSFNSLWQEIGHPEITAVSPIEIKSIYNYGFRMNPDWIDKIQSQLDIPVYLLNFDKQGKYQISLKVENLPREELFRFAESVSNVV